MSYITILLLLLMRAMLYAGADFKPVCEKLVGITNKIADVPGDDETPLKAEADQLFTQCMDILLKDLQLNNYTGKTKRNNLTNRHYNSILK